MNENLLHIAEQLRPLAVPISSLKFDQNNSRKHDDANLSAIRFSLTKFGQQKPIVVDKSNVVVAGNGTLEAATSLGWTMIAASKTDLEGKDAIAYAHADNRTSELATWDQEMLSRNLAQLPKADAIGIGWQEGTLDRILSNGSGSGHKEQSPIPSSIQVVIECDSEKQQRTVYERMKGEGFKCRLLTL